MASQYLTMPTEAVESLPRNLVSVLTASKSAPSHNMRRDDKASYDGITKIIKGVHSAAAPIVLPRTQLAWADNIECRTDFMRPRNGWSRHLLTFTGRTDACETSAMVQTAFEDRIFEGAIVFERFSQIVCMIGGHLFSIDPLR